MWCCGVVTVVAAAQCDRLGGARRDGRVSQAGFGIAPRFTKLWISHTPHLMLHGLKDELAARSVKVSYNAV
jgi:hypothetical protein